MNPAAIAGGDLPALGYLPPNTFQTQAQVQRYEALIARGATPEYAKMQALRLRPRGGGFWSDLIGGAENFIEGSLSGFAQDVAKGNFSPGALAAGVFAPSFTSLSPSGIEQGAAPSLSNLTQVGGGETSSGVPVLAVANALARGGQAVASSPRRGRFGALPAPQNEAAARAQQNFLRNLETGLEAVPQAIQQGVRLANEIGPYLPAPFGGTQFTPPGPGPDGQPTAGVTSQGIPILDQGTPCATCGEGNALEVQPGGPMGPTLNPPPPQPGDNFTLPPPGGSNVAEVSPAFQPDATYNNIPLVTMPGPQSGGGGLTPPGPQGGPGSTLGYIHQLQEQLQNEIQVEQQQQQQEQQHNLELQRIGQQIQQLRDLETIPPDQRDIPSELNLKRQLQAQLQNIANQIQPQRGQQGPDCDYARNAYWDTVPNPTPEGEAAWLAQNYPGLRCPGVSPMPGSQLRPAPTPPGSQPRAPQLAPAPQMTTPQRSPQGPGPQGGGEQPKQPVQFCVGCQSSEDAILFLNGEPSNCSVIPGSTQPIGAQGNG